QGYANHLLREPSHGDIAWNAVQVDKLAQRDREGTTRRAVQVNNLDRLRAFDWTLDNGHTLVVLQGNDVCRDIHAGVGMFGSAYGGQRVVEGSHTRYDPVITRPVLAHVEA